MTAASPLAIARAAGLRLSVPQIVALKCVEGETLTRAELAAFRTLSRSERGPRPGGYRETWIRAGRRSGKTIHIGAAFAVSELLAPVDHLLAPGERARVLAIGPTLPHTRQLLDGVAGILATLGIPHVPKELTIDLPGRRTYVAATVADHLGARSGTAKAAVIDEAALLPSDEGADGFDQEVIAAVRPALATTRGRMLVLSSPWARAGAHFEVIEANLGHPERDVLALQGPTWVWHPDLTEAETRKLEPDPRRWAREWKGEPGDTEASAFDSRDVERAITPGLAERAPSRAIQYGAAGDLAFRGDGAALGIAHVQTARLPSAPPIARVVVDVMRVRRAQPGQPLDPERLIEEWAGTLRRYGVRRLWLDGHGYDLAAARFRERGIRCDLLPMGLEAQAVRFDRLGGRLRAGTIDLPDVPVLKRELCELRVELLGGGRVRYEAPRRKSASDDTADVCAALCAEATAKLGAAGDVSRSTSVHWTERGIEVSTRWVERLPNGSQRPCEPPHGTIEFDQWANEMLESGHSTPSIEAWRRERQAEGSD